MNQVQKPAPWWPLKKTTHSSVNSAELCNRSPEATLGHLAPIHVGPRADFCRLGSGLNSSCSCDSHIKANKDAIYKITCPLERQSRSICSLMTLLFKYCFQIKMCCCWVALTFRRL